MFEPFIGLGESLALGIGKVGVSDAPEAIHSTLSHNSGREQPSMLAAALFKKRSSRSLVAFEMPPQLPSLGRRVVSDIENKKMRASQTGFTCARMHPGLTV